jgi:hypothetical protein
MEKLFLTSNEVANLLNISQQAYKIMEELERGISRLSIENNELKREFDKLSWE